MTHQYTSHHLSWGLPASQEWKACSLVTQPQQWLFSHLRETAISQVSYAWHWIPKANVATMPCHVPGFCKVPWKMTLPATWMSTQSLHQNEITPTKSCTCGKINLELFHVNPSGIVSRIGKLNSARIWEELGIRRKWEKLWTNLQCFGQGRFGCWGMNFRWWWEPQIQDIEVQGKAG